MFLSDDEYNQPYSINLASEESKVRVKIEKAPKRELFVTSEGFEPPTLGAEIRYSIQLNYEAIL